MDVFIYFTDQLPCGLDELEDSINEALEDLGEVSGTGSGQMGGNIDIEILNEEATQAEVVRVIRDAISQFDLPRSSYMTIGEEKLAIHGTEKGE